MPPSPSLLSLSLAAAAHEAAGDLGVFEERLLHLQGERIDDRQQVALDALTKAARASWDEAVELAEEHGDVLVSTAAASIGLQHHEAIAAAKGGIEGLVRSAAATYGPAGIRFNFMPMPLMTALGGSASAGSAPGMMLPLPPWSMMNVGVPRT